MRALAKLRQKLFGKPLDPLDTKTRRHIALVAFFAWVGLGADGISSSCYGHEEAFRALGEHTDLGLYLALATAATVFIIALAYNQVIELFPTGGGGYRVATRLIGPYAGLVSGAALILDYVLTVSISIASGVDALFSLFPLPFQRSEEHTSELQSQSNLVCRLLLEKKKKTSSNISAPPTATAPAPSASRALCPPTKAATRQVSDPPCVTFTLQPTASPPVRHTQHARECVGGASQRARHRVGLTRAPGSDKFTCSPVVP